MRITGGRARGIRLAAPAEGLEVRPATDRWRESVFASLSGQLEGARVLDLFAGTGAYGLEAYSRGAVEVILVEQARRVIPCLRKNVAAVIKSVGHETATAPCTVVEGDVLRGGHWKAAAFDFCFVDPPYALYEGVFTLSRLFALAEEVLLPGGCLVAEMPGFMDTAGFGWIESRRFGKDRHGPSVRLLRRECV